MTDIFLSNSRSDAANSTNLGQSTLTTNFNVPPYYDDYDPNNQYYKILYKPGYAVQARELTQMQSMLQSQISRFGRHVFREGSIVLPGAFTIRAGTQGTINTGPGNPVDYVKISDLDPTTNTTINLDDFYQQTIRGASSNISAYVIDVLPSDGTTQNTNTLYVAYLGVKPGDPTVRTFVQGETLSSNNGSTSVLTSSQTDNPIGKASWFQIQEGVFYAKEHFIYFPTQSVVLDRYGVYPSCQVGFYVNEEIINYTKDINLLDPALGSSNYSAPGADRLRLLSKLSVLRLGETAGPPDFVPLLTIKNGIIQTIAEKSSYNILGDVMANRTNNESGDYVVKGLNVQVGEHLKIDSPLPNFGRYPAAGNPAGNSQLLVATVDPGIGYVKGYGVQTFDRFDIPFTKPQEYEIVNEQLAALTMGQYIKVNEFVGTWELNKGIRVNFYDTPQKRISNFGQPYQQKWSGSNQSGNNIGSAIVTSVQYESGVPGYDAVYNIYLTDIKMSGNNTFANVASLYKQNSPYASSGADVLGAQYPVTSNTSLYEVSKAPLLFYVGSDWTRKVKDEDNVPRGVYYFNQTIGIDTIIYLSSSGKLTQTLSLGTNQQLPYGTTTLSGLSDRELLNDFTVTIGQSFNVGPLWNATVVRSGLDSESNKIIGSNTYFTDLNVGDKIEIEGFPDYTWYITQIENDYSIRLSDSVPEEVTGNLIFKAFKTGDTVDMSGLGSNGGSYRSITTTPTAFTIDIREDLPSEIPVTVSYKVASRQTQAATKTLRPNRYVVISCADVGTSGPFCLGFSDVYSINQIVRKSGSVPTGLDDIATDDVTKYFTLDNGQKDTLYDLGYIKKSKGLTLEPADYLLVSLNYFSPNFTGAGSFFTIDSYPINDGANTTSSQIRTEQIPIYISPTNSLKYDLRNQIDFRPVKACTAVDATDPSAATINPSDTSSSLLYNGSGINFPEPDSTFMYDYSYYLGRIDIVCVNKDGSMVVVEGTASTTPATPIPSDTQMIIAIINTTPYPSLSPAYANVLKRYDLSCKVRKASNRVYTMRDIGILDKRISNLEYYTSLTLLEKNALNFLILDENGINRFKNGIFVDPFRDKSLSAYGVDKDYRIVTDPREFSIRPLFSTDSVGYDYITGSGVTVSNNNLVMLNYNEVLQFNQPRVTDIRELERGIFFFQGSMRLLPEQDVWIDVNQLPDEIVEFTSNGSMLDVNIIYGGAPGQVLDLEPIVKAAGITAGDTITLDNLTYRINVGDRIIGVNSGDTGNSAVLSIADIPTNTQYKMANSTYRIGEKVNVYNSTGYMVSTITDNIKVNGLIPGPGVTPGDKITILNVSSSSNVKSNLKVWGATSKKLSNITAVITATSTNTVIQLANSGFQIGEKINVYPSNTTTLYSSTGAQIAIQPLAVGTISGITNAFGITVGTRIYGRTSQATANGYVSSIISSDTFAISKAGYVNGEVIEISNATNVIISTATVANTVRTQAATIKAVANAFTIKIGDRLYGNISLGAANGYVISTNVAGTPNNKFQTSNVGYLAGERVSIYNVMNILIGTANVKTVVVANTIVSTPGVVANIINQTAAVTKNLINTEWGNWQTTVTGYNLYRGDGASKVFVGFFTTADAAKKAAASWTTQQNGGTATLETVYNNTRTGTDYFANYSGDQAVGSNKVLSMESIPYIRSQKIAVKVTNLRGYSKMNAFFDGINMTTYCTPLSETQYNAYVSGKPIPADSNNAFPVEGADLIVDDYGALHFLLRIPSADTGIKFRCGQRKLVVIDNTNIDANSLDLTEDTSTSAHAMFFAQGTAETLQRTVYSTKGYTVTTDTESQSYTSSTSQVLPNTWTPPPKGHCCFDPDAKVLMADCTWKAIKDVVEGDKVIGDNNTVNTVLKNKTIGVGGRKMLKLKNSGFYTTDDHLFLTKKGWKTWRPDIVLRDADHTTNGFFLIGDNREKSIDTSDHLKTVKIHDGKVVEEFTPYEDAEVHDFDHNFLVHDLTLDGNMTYIVDGYVVHNCCVAYSVLIRAPDDEEGIFCTGFNFYIARKSRTRGLWAEIGTVDNTGQVTADRIPGTQVFLSNNQIPVSNTGADNAVHIRFPAPVFLFNKKTYAFIIHSDSPSVFNVDPDTQIWISRLGQLDKITGSTVSNREGTGQFWQTTNNVNWYEEKDLDLKMEIYRANFTPTVTSFIIGNEPLEKLHLGYQSLSFRRLLGDHFTTGDKLTLTGVSTVGSNVISVGNRVRGNISLDRANSSIVTVLGVNQYEMLNSSYYKGENVTIYNDTNDVIATANIGAISNSTAVLTYIDESQINIYSEWASSTGGFSNNQTLMLVGHNGENFKAKIQYINDFNYSTVSLQPKVLNFAKTGIRYEMDTYDLDEVTSSGYIRINDQDTIYLPTEKQIYSRTNELNKINGTQSNKVRVTFASTSNYVSPVLDLDHTHTIIIDNLINANTYGEGIVYADDGSIDSTYSGAIASSGGGALNKYISQTVTLDEGQDAEDLRIILSCYRPPGTDVIVYAKLMHSEDPEPFTSKNWIKMNKINNGDFVFSSLADRNNFRDFTFVLPKAIMTAENGAFQYTNAQGTLYTSFRYYAIKIVLTATNPAVVPRASDLRAIALQM